MTQKHVDNGHRRRVTQYSAAERTRLIEAQAASGQSKRDFCRAQGINLGTFYGWGKGTRRGAPLFAEVQIEAREADAPIEVDLPNGVRIRVHASGEVDRTARLVRQVIAPEQA